MLIVNITDDVKIAIHAYRSIIAKLDEAAALVNEPEFAAGRGRGCLLRRKRASDDDTLLDVALLRDQQHLIAGSRGTDDTPSVACPGR